MGQIRFKGRGRFLSLAMAFFLIFPPNRVLIYAETTLTSSTGSSLPQAGDLSGVVNNYKNNLSGQLQSISTSCMGTQFIGQFTNAMNAYNRNGVNGAVAAACAAMQAATPVSILSPPCPEPVAPYTSFGGTDSCALAQDKVAFNNLMNQLRQAECSIECKNARRMAAQQEAQCLAQQISAINQQATQVSQNLKAYLQQMRQGLLVLDQDIAGKSQALQSTNEKIQVLKEKQKQLQEKLTQLAGFITQVKMSVNNYNQRKKVLDSQKQRQVMTSVATCLKSLPVAGYHCPSWDSRNLSIEDYLICKMQYAQSTYADQQGRTIQDGTLAQIAKQKSESIQSAFDLANSDSSSISSIPDTAEESQKSTNAPQSILNSVADWQARMKPYLNGINIGGQNAFAFFDKGLKFCHNRAVTVSNQMLANQDSTLSKGYFENKQFLIKVQEDMANELVQGSQVYSDVTGAMNPATATPLNLNACTNASPDRQVNCLENVQKRLNNLLNGNAGQFVIPILGGTANSSFTVLCNSESTCANKLQAAAQVQKANLTQEQNVRQATVLQDNQMINSVKRMVAQQLNMTAQVISQKMNMIASVLGIVPPAPATCGADSSSNLQSKEILPDSEVDPMDITCQANLPDPVKMGQMMGQVSQVPSSDLRISAQVYDALQQLSSLPERCKNEEGENLLNNASDLMGQIQGSNCEPSYCKNPTHMNQLASAIDKAQQSLGNNPRLSLQVSDLETGYYQGLCRDDGAITALNQQLVDQRGAQDEYNKQLSKLNGELTSESSSSKKARIEGDIQALKRKLSANADEIRGIESQVQDYKYSAMGVNSNGPACRSISTLASKIMRAVNSANRYPLSQGAR